MTYKQFKRNVRKLLKKRNTKVYIPLAGLFLVTAVTLKIYMTPQPVQVDPASYAALLNTIAKGESKGNYNAYFGNASNSKIKFTDMTIAQIQQWQQDYVKNGSPSSAVGKYQIVRPTLNGLIAQLNINPDQKFDAQMQDRMAVALLERRGSVNFVDNKLTREQFAENIAKEWAALPKTTGDNPDHSYYEGDGLNKSRISVDEVFGALGQLKKL